MSRTSLHLAEHDVTPSEVESVLENAPQFFTNLPRRIGTHVMLGPYAQGSFLDVVLVESAVPGAWRPITAYRYARRRANRYYRRTQ